MKDYIKRLIQNEWVSIAERFPPFNEFVLVSYPPVLDGLSVGINIYSEKNGWELRQTESYVQGITHWMSLPELLKNEVK